MVTWSWVLVRGGADCAWVLLISYGGFWKNFLFYVAAVALVVFVLVWVLPVEYSAWIFRDACATWLNSGYMSTGGFGQLSAFFYVEVNSNPEAFFLHSVEWRSVHSQCFHLQFLQRG